MRSSTPLLLAVPLLLLAGCPPMGVRGTARILPRGESSLYAALGPNVARRPVAGEDGVLRPTLLLEPAYDLGFAHAMTDDLETGFSLWGSGRPYLPSLAGTLKYRFLSPERWPLPVHVAVAPKITFPGAYFELPLLVGLDVAGDDELLLAPKAQWRITDAQLVPTFVGGTVAWAFRLPALGVTLKPEVGVVYALRHVSDLFIATPITISEAGEYRWIAMLEVGTLPKPKR